MFRGYNLDAEEIDRDSIVKYEAVGRALFENNKRQIKRGLDSYQDDSGDLLASKITDQWFPDVDADVFLSHSHKDEVLVMQLAGWLKDTFGLVSFIDSCIWGYSDHLLKIIDDRYCYKRDTKTYNYQERNRSTSHVHMMLSTALTKMIHSCECVFFINTPASISTEGYIKSTGVTKSPWIYSEILTTKLIQKRRPDEHRRRRVVKEALETYKEATASVTVKYDLDVSHLIPINVDDLIAWKENNSLQGPTSLDILYALKQR